VPAKVQILSPAHKPFRKRFQNEPTKVHKNLVRKESFDSSGLEKVHKKTKKK